MSEHEQSNADTDKIAEVAEVGYLDLFRKGDRLALLDCLIWCNEHSLRLPRWATDELAKSAQRYLDRTSENFHDAVFGARKDVGRHAQPATKRANQHTDQLLFDVVTALRKKGFKGDGLYETTQDVLGRLRPNVIGGTTFSDITEKRDPDTIKKRYLQLRKNGAKASKMVDVIPHMVDWPKP